MNSKRVGNIFSTVQDEKSFDNDGWKQTCTHSRAWKWVTVKQLSTYIDFYEDISETDTAQRGVFASLLSRGFTTMAVINQYKSKIKEHDIKTEIVENIG